MSIAQNVVFGPLCLLAPVATQKDNRGPLNGAVSAQKVFPGSETETRELLGGTEANSVSRQGSLISPTMQVDDFLTHMAPPNI